MPKRTPGLYKRWSKAQQAYIYEIDKQIGGERLRESTGTSDLEEANRLLTHRVEQFRKRQKYGEAPERIFFDAATRYLEENGHKRSLERDIRGLDVFLPDIGNLPLRQVHQGTLQRKINERLRAGISPATIDRELAPVRRILSLSARLWRDENGEPWLATEPLISHLPNPTKRRPYPITWGEQTLLFPMLPDHLRTMALFGVNTGMRDKEICYMQWRQEERVDGHSLFIVPDYTSKNSTDRVVICNRVAQSIIDAQRGKHKQWVFPRVLKNGTAEPIARMNNTGWKNARKKAAARYMDEIGIECPAGFAKLRVHDLRHTFGRRLRAADVSEEDRKDLLGHKSRSVTTEYSGAEIHRLIDAANKVCDGVSRPMLRVVG